MASASLSIPAGFGNPIKQNSEAAILNCDQIRNIDINENITLLEGMADKNKENGPFVFLEVNTKN